LKRYGKNYETREEFLSRFQIFKENLKIIEKLNSKGSKATFGITKFSDMTKEEFHSFPCGTDNLKSLSISKNKIQLSPLKSKSGIPVSWDWTEHGAVTPVKNQGSCGSCWAFSCIGNIEGAWFLKGHPLTNLSEQQFVDCSASNSGCGGGWPYLAMEDIAQFQNQVDTEVGYPYTEQNGKCTFSKSDVGASFKTFSIFCNEHTQVCSEIKMASTLYTDGPLSACLDATPFQFYTGGIIDSSDCSSIQIDHCITLVGYGSSNGTDFWKIKNSWGADWGEKGFVRLEKGKGACGINVAVTGVSC